MAKEKTIAEKWIQRIDDNSPEKMIEEADSEVDDGSGSVYIFEDGSAVYEKRRGDWELDESSQAESPVTF
jgi:hypothetical protein